MDEQITLRIDELVLKSVEGIIEPEECRELESLISSNPEALEYYTACVELNAGMLRIQDVISRPLQMSMALETMAAYEKAAPSVVSEKEVPQRQLIQKVIYEKHPRKISNVAIISAAASAAAILFLVLFVRYMPKEQYDTEVAIVVDQMNVKWGNPTIKFANGDRLLTNRTPIALDKGIFEIQYDDGVIVLIEGPAKFALQLSGVYVEYGRLFSRVPKTGLGFLVETPTTRFVDLGTEFGVQADVNGSSELHVMKGKVQLFAGPKEKAKSSLIVTENKAVRYNANSTKLDEVPVEKESFVQSINSSTKSIWRGQMKMDLADVVAGHDGFKQLGSWVGINPANGKFTSTAFRERRIQKDASYHPVVDSDFIDGVFVPDGKLGPIPISSTGHTFNCPNTSGMFTCEIAGYKGGIEYKNVTPNSSLIFSGKEYENNSIVLLHSNVGITFDLQAMRRYTKLDIKHFKAKAALYQLSPDVTFPDVDVWVLVDGQIKFQRQALKVEHGLIPFTVELNPQDRFMTIVVTEGHASENGTGEFLEAVDYFCLINPELWLGEWQQGQ